MRERILLFWCFGAEGRLALLRILSLGLRRVALCMLLVISMVAKAEEPIVPIERSDYSRPTGIAPAYFGPNAFPIPDMLDGRTESRLRLELAADGYFGFKKTRLPTFLRACTFRSLPTA